MDVPRSGPAPGGHVSAGAAAPGDRASKRGIPQQSACKDSASKDRETIAWRLLALGVLLPVISLSVFRAVPVPWPTPVVQLLAFTPWLVVPAILALGMALAGRRGWLTALAAAVLAAQLFWLFPLDAGRPVPGSSVPGTRISVLNINAQFGQADAAETVRLIREHGVGLLAVQEHTQALDDRLAAQGIQHLLPHKFSDPQDDASGSAIYSAHPMEAVGVLPDTRFRMPTVRLTIRQGDADTVLEITNVHAFPPVAGRAAQWRSDLAALGRLAAAGTGDTPVAAPGPDSSAGPDRSAGPGASDVQAGPAVPKSAAAVQSNRLLIGDFNATFDHAEFRAVLDAGEAPDGGGGRKLVDVGTAAGLRLLPTWPVEGLPLPGIAIDHVVTSPLIASSGYAVHRVPGTDHAAVLATLEIPPGG